MLVGLTIVTFNMNIENELTRFKLYLLQGEGTFDGKRINRSKKTVDLHIRTIERVLRNCPSLSVSEVEHYILLGKYPLIAGSWLWYTGFMVTKSSFYELLKRASQPLVPRAGKPPRPDDCNGKH